MKQFFLFGAFLLSFQLKTIAQEPPSVSGWAVSKEGSNPFEQQDPVELAHKIHNYQKRIIAFASSQSKTAELDALRNTYQKKQAVLAPNYPTVPLGATFEQIHAWLRQYPAEVEHYQNILDSILENLNQ